MSALTACSSQTPATDPVPNCGWDTSITAGQEALNDYLSSTELWLKTNPDLAPPAPMSKYWMGDCPNDGTNIGPPVEEAGDSSN